MAKESGFYGNDLLIIAGLMKMYRGLRIEDLDSGNPSYSCVICSKFNECGRLECACPNAEPATEEQFALCYDFKEEN